MSDNIDIEFIKELAERTRFEYEICHEPYGMRHYYGDAPRMHINGYTEVK